MNKIPIFINDGNIISIAIAFHKQSIRASSFTGSQVGIITSNQHTNASIVDINLNRLNQCIQSDNIAIIAGFQGYCPSTQSVTTLGRGGSDITAVAIATALECQSLDIYKDVGAIFSENPNHNPCATKHRELSYQTAQSILNKTGDLLHPKSLTIAEKNNIEIHIYKLNDPNKPGTIIKKSKVAP